MSSPGEIDVRGAQSVNNSVAGNSISLESMILLAHTSNLKKLENKMEEKLPEIKEQQEDIQLYHLVEMKMNTEADVNGDLQAQKFDQIIADMRQDFKSKLEQHLEKAENPEQKEKLSKRLAHRMEILDEIVVMGAKIRNDADKFSSDQKNRFCSNLKTQADDLKVQVDLNSQQFTRLINHSHESHQFARTMLKTLDDMKKGPARAMGGR